MKKLILSCLTTAAVVSISACTTVETRPVAPAPVLKTTTTTTERSTVRHPVTGTTETQTTRTYQ